MTQELVPVQQATEQGETPPSMPRRSLLSIPQQAFWFTPHWHATLLVKGHVHATTCYYNRQSAQKSDRKSPELNLLLL